MTEQLKPRKRVLDFIADAFDMFFGGQELHRARNALTPPPPPKEQPMNLDDYIFKCPTCYDSQQVRVPASHSYKPCPDCAPKKTPEPARSLWGAPKRETPTPFDEIAPEMLAGVKTSQPEPPPTGKGELVTPSLLAALRAHPDLHALVAARDAFGRAKYDTGLRIDNGRDALEDAHQELGDLLQYLWQAKMEGRDITHALDQMARAISVLQGGKR